MPQKYDQLGPAGKRLARVPRYGRLIALLEPQRFARLVSEAATYWEVYTYINIDSPPDTGVLDGGLVVHAARTFGVQGNNNAPATPDFREFQVRFACHFLGAVAYEMFFAGPQPRSAVSDTQSLKSAVVNRLHEAKVCDFFGDPFTNKLDLLRNLETVFAMDATELKYLIFSSRDREVRWTDVTTHAFFAAYWVVNWTSKEELERLWTLLPDPMTRSNPEYEEFWRFAAEMPVEAVDRARYERLFSRLCDGTWVDKSGQSIRSTELIYRTWERMKETEAGKKFRSQFPSLVAKRGKVACQLLTFTNEQGKPQSQFVSLCQGEQGDGDNGQFLMGAPDGEAPSWDGSGENQNNPQHSVRLTHCRVHRYCVSNVEYELFDGRHASRRAFTDRVKDAGSHPVVNVSWYDAWCFAKWVGELKVNGQPYEVSLPTEAQWEYACRAGERTPFSWGGGHDGNRIESAYCSFDGNYPWERPGSGTVARKGTYRQRTVRVDGRDEDGSLLLANKWGFFQMHGNVWEWCMDWYDPRYYRVGAGQEVRDPKGPSMAIGRVLRGGCWFSRGWFCRSGYRFRDAPVGRYWSRGFRLAAVPVTGGQVGGSSGA